MEIVRCPKGHFYDADVNTSCPQCAREAKSSFSMDPVDAAVPASPVEPPEAPPMHTAPPVVRMPGPTMSVADTGFKDDDFKPAAPPAPEVPVVPVTSDTWSTPAKPMSSTDWDAPAWWDAPAPEGPAAPQTPPVEEKPEPEPVPVPVPTPVFEPEPVPAPVVEPAPVAEEIPAPEPEVEVAPAMQEAPAPVQEIAPVVKEVPAPVPEPVVEVVPAVKSVPVSSVQEPVTGWVVCVEGPDRGRDFRLFAGYNYVGRSANMDVCLAGDERVANENAAMIGYDDLERVFSFGPAGGRSPVRVNGKMVVGAAELKAYDELTVGASKLLFIPLCGEHFDWGTQS